MIQSDRKDHSNSNGNDEIQFDSSWSKRNPLDLNWKAKVRYRRDAAILWSRGRKCSTQSRCFNVFQRCTKPERLIKEKEGKTITEIQEQRNRWVGYFEEFLSRSASLEPPDIEAAPTDLPVDLTPQTTEEIRMAIRQIKSAKAAEPDNMPAKALKSDTEVTARILHLLFRKIWEEEQVATDWKEKHLIKIPKKGDLNKCENYRGITLLSVPGNVFNKLLQNRVKDSEDNQLRDQRAGFHKTSTSEGKHGMQWTAQNQLDDSDFADDLVLLSHTHEQMQTKTASVAAVSASPTTKDYCKTTTTTTTNTNTTTPTKSTITNNNSNINNNSFYSL
ncbi:unnamed protein product [Schistosoma mattheei]|uniref:Uncharacterized protein n=1 Tax=Schistosoma mattheei TaxID=31246 RepID=A0A183NTV7_9TREM|nr:unnamed protein product [Schistosoma mattheei]